jgi:hypothetical protein
VARAEAERLNAEGYGDGERWELLSTTVHRHGESRVTLAHRLRDRRSGQTVETTAYTNYE